MSEHEDAMLVAAAEAVTDGMTVDWEGLRAKNPALADDLTAMEAMAEVARAYQALWEGDASPNG